MKMNGATGHRYQSGAATLLIALLLMMSITVITLAVARTQISEQRIAAGQSWNTRLFLGAEAGLARGIAYLTRSMEDIVWTRASDHTSLSKHLPVESSDPQIRTDVVFSHPRQSDTFLSVHATSRRSDASGARVHVAQYVRPLSILTPLVETAPPLIINGCLVSLPLHVHIRPLNADTDQAGDSIWLNRNVPCPVPLPLPVDIHGGHVREIGMGDDLWQWVFSITREQYETLAEQQRSLPARERRYWVAQDTDLRAGRWNQSLGSAEAPVALYFGAEPGCPEFSPGVRIHGVVFIDAECAEPVASHSFELFGSLVVNGNLNVRNAALRLNHIQIADRLQARLRFPVLRSVPLPGSWRDF